MRLIVALIVFSPTMSPTMSLILVPSLYFWHNEQIDLALII